MKNLYAAASEGEAATRRNRRKEPVTFVRTLQTIPDETRMLTAQSIITSYAPIAM